MLLSIKTIRVSLAVALGFACSAMTAQSHAQVVSAPVSAAAPGMGASIPTSVGMAPTTQMGPSSGGGAGQGSSPNQATSLKTGTGKQPTLVGSALTVSVLGTNGQRAVDLGFIGPDGLTQDYYAANSLVAQQAAGGGGTNRSANRNATTSTRGAATNARQSRTQGQQRNNTTNGASGKPAKSGVRAALRSEISVRPQAVVAYTSQFKNRMSNLPALQRFNNRIHVSVVGRTATLRGTVNSKREAEMLAKLALMEAGISAVDNQLVVLTADADK